MHVIESTCLKFHGIANVSFFWCRSEFLVSKFLVSYAENIIEENTSLLLERHAYLDGQPIAHSVCIIDAFPCCHLECCFFSVYSGGAGRISIAVTSNAVSPVAGWLVIDVG